MSVKKGTDEKSLPVVSKSAPSTQKPQKSRPAVVMELLGLPKITLKFKNVDTGSEISLTIQKEPRLHEIGEGHWELTGFVENEKSYASLETSKKFVFHVTPKGDVYAGSIILGCPRVANDEFQYLKNMKFFNRYPFSTESGICELVIGNDQRGVEKKLQKALNSKNLSLIIGF